MSKRKSRSTKEKKPEPKGPVYPFHPACLAVPEMGADEKKRLAADIKLNGQIEPIMLVEEDDQTMILDGRNRWRICRDLGIEPKTDLYTGDNPWGYVLSKNISRRHLSKSQIGLYLGKMPKPAQGQKGSSVPRTDDGSEQVHTAEELAKSAGVSASTVERGRTVNAKGGKEVKEAVEKGELNLKDAADIAKNVPKGKQGEAVKEATERRKPEPVKNVKPDADAKIYDHIYINMTDPMFTKKYGSKGMTWSNIKPSPKEGVVILHVPSDGIEDGLDYIDILRNDQGKGLYLVTTVMVKREKRGKVEDGYSKATHDVLLFLSPTLGLGRKDKINNVMEYKEWIQTMKTKLDGRRIALLGDNVDGWDKDFS